MTISIEMIRPDVERFVHIGSSNLFDVADMFRSDDFQEAVHTEVISHFLESMTFFYDRVSCGQFKDTDPVLRTDDMVEMPCLWDFFLMMYTSQQRTTGKSVTISFTPVLDGVIAHVRSVPGNLKLSDALASIGTPMDFDDLPNEYMEALVADLNPLHLSFDYSDFNAGDTVLSTLSRDEHGKRFTSLMPSFTDRVNYITYLLSITETLQSDSSVPQVLAKLLSTLADEQAEGNDVLVAASLESEISFPDVFGYLSNHTLTQFA